MMRKNRRILDVGCWMLDDSIRPTSNIQHPTSLRMHRRKSGQTFVETTVLLLAIASALVLFFTFVRNAVSSRIKTGSDTFGHGLLHNGP